MELAALWQDSGAGSAHISYCKFHRTGHQFVNLSTLAHVVFACNVYNAASFLDCRTWRQAQGQNVESPRVLES